MLSICSESEALTNNGVLIPFVEINPAYPLLAITIIGVAFILLRKALKVDFLTALLFGRIFLCLIPVLLYDMPSSYIGNFVVACFPFLIYIFFSNCNINIQKATTMLIWFGMVIAIQCIWAYLVIRQNDLASYDDLYYKNYFVIPVGATNNISAILLPLTIVGDQTIQSRKYRFVYLAVLLAALFLCKSRTGLILAVLYLFFKIFLKERGRHSTFKKLLICLLPLIVFAAAMFLEGTNLWDNIRSLLMGYSSSGDGLDSLLSGRFGVFGNVLEHIAEHPWVGNGVTYEKTGYVRSHNAFLQILYENGIVGLIGFVAFLCIAIHRVIKAKAVNVYYYSFYIAMPFVLINAMVEETLLGHFMVLFGLLYLTDIKKVRGK